MTTKELDVKKVNFIKNLKKEEYKPYYSYCRIEDVQEVIRGNCMLSTKDTPKPVKVEGIDFILFLAKATGIVVDFVCVQNKGKFELLEMSLKAYNEYENYMRENR
jgi:hypothetical protein